MVVRFKQADETILKQLLHKIPAEDYNLISGVKVIITDNDFKKASSAGFYNYNGINIDFSLIEENPTDEVLNFGPEYFQLIDHVSENFIHSKEMVDALYTGLSLEENVLFYGRGGHGKLNYFRIFA